MKRPSIAKRGDSELLLMQSLIIDQALLCGVDLSRDLRRLEMRYLKEGISFLTLALPELSGWLESSLENGIQPIPKGWKKATDKPWPVFLQSLTEIIFSGESEEENIARAIFSFRQITRAWKKTKLECRPETNANAVQKFLSTDERAHRFQQLLSASTYMSSERHLYKGVSDGLYHALNTQISDAISGQRISVRHGSGAVSDSHLSPNGKWDIQWGDHLEWLFPRDSYWTPVNLIETDRSSVRDFGPSRIALVPKTQKGPRVIACEPAGNMFIQQGLMAEIYNFVDRSSLHGKIGFRNQERQQEAARKGSIDGSLATIDLSSASDLLLEAHVDLLLRDSHLKDAIMLTRTKSTILPDGTVHHLSKFCTQGSALCFPLETMVFYALCLTACLLVRKPSATYADGYKLGADILKGRIKHSSEYSCEDIHQVACFGDDIIVPNWAFQSCTELLESFGFLVNTGKSFSKGSFRESCGGDYWGGWDVTPVYFRNVVPDSASSQGSLVSLIETGNNMYLSGNWFTADLCRRFVDDLLGVLPINQNDNGLLSHTSFGPASLQGLRQVWDTDLQRLVLTGLGLSVKPKKDTITELGRLRKALHAKRTPIIGLLDEVEDLTKGAIKTTRRYSSVITRTKV